MLASLLKHLLACSLLRTSLCLSPLDTRVDGYENSAYFANWGIYARNYRPQQLPADVVTNIYYAFANFQDDGTVFSSDPWADTQINLSDASTPASGSHAYGCVKQLFLLKKAHRNTKVNLSVGGWTYSLNGRFASAVSTEPKRIQFAKSSVSLMKDWGFDGIDIDWEYPANASEAADFLALLKAVRAELDDYAARSVPGYHFRLTAAMPAGPDKYSKLPLFDMAQIVDAFNLMAYDYAGSFSPLSAHQANLYPNSGNLGSTPFSTDAAITGYLAAGVPRYKIILGIPLFGRAFENTSGVGKPYSGIGKGSWEDGVWDYKALPRSHLDVQKDAIAGATYTYDNNSQQLISYDTPSMVKAKIDYLRSEGLGGSMFWEASGDRNDAESLIRISYFSLGALRQSQNNLQYPDSTYANIAAGMP
ncbi:hypothetical protein PG994_009837 [Apiospora phragmitis]|uniref:chitinase n=1 Tax=Apiospora phragmitis TaxID=2905665 RepID=A0ABR1U9J3_9PEZI